MLVPFDPAARVHLGVVTLGTPARLGECLEALRTHESRHDFVVSVCVNADRMTPGPLTVQVPDGMRVERPAANLGWGAGLARLRGLAESEYFVWVQDDMLPEPGWLDALVDAADAHPRVAVFGALRVDDEGRSCCTTEAWPAAGRGRGLERGRHHRRGDADRGHGAGLGHEQGLPDPDRGLRRGRRARPAAVAAEPCGQGLQHPRPLPRLGPGAGAGVPPPARGEPVLAVLLPRVPHRLARRLVRPPVGRARDGARGPDLGRGRSTRAPSGARSGPTSSRRCPAGRPPRCWSRSPGPGRRPRNAGSRSSWDASPSSRRRSPTATSVVADLEERRRRLRRRIARLRRRVDTLRG